jgi:ABC-type multidrug transport system fused ATPase/permease subunit
VNAAGDMQAGLAAVRRTRQIHVLPTEPAAPSTQVNPMATEPASIAFRQVSFHYPGTREPVLDDISFQTPPGGMTAFVGPSGAGKSTIFALLERFYDTITGSILLDGRDVREWPLGELRATIGYVEQDVPVLAATLRDNIRLAAPDASDEHILEVVVRTRLDDLLTRLPDGLDTMLSGPPDGPREPHGGLTICGTSTSTQYEPLCTHRTCMITRGVSLDL